MPIESVGASGVWSGWVGLYGRNLGDCVARRALVSKPLPRRLTQKNLPVQDPGVAFAVAWSPSGELLVSGGSDGRLHWWEVQSGECVRVRETHQGTVYALKVSPDGGILASCGNDGAILLWNLHNGEHLQTLRRDRPYERLNITGIRGLTEAQKASLRALGAIENTPVPAIQHAP